ncbi:MAG: 16S rRNA (uracil(1498)-N(3))-methyltransferase [Bacteroidetes bacterium]|nr:16S rRNA (uracil(1498)-N(3))-methyltransferase [Bacteroidota bacterium]
MIDNQYFYALPSDITADSLSLRDEEARHCQKVLRKKKGDRFFVVDGMGHEFLVTVHSIHSGSVLCTIEDKKIRPREPDISLHLGIAVLKRDAMDWVIEKAVELGVTEIHPLITTRSVVDAGGSKAARWQKIALSAMKQSRRSVLPPIHPSVQFHDLLCSDHRSSDLLLMAHEAAAEPLDIQSPIPSAIFLLIGPEGGFTDDETELAANHGYTTFSLGTRRLRSETAAIASLSRLLSFPSLSGRDR